MTVMAPPGMDFMTDAVAHWAAVRPDAEALTYGGVRWTWGQWHDRIRRVAGGLAALGLGRGVGIARYVRDTDDPRAAEIAVTIADDWQGRGLGTELLARLSDRARQAGIGRFTATVSADNVAMTRLLWKMGARLAGRSRGTMEYEVALEAVDDYSLDWWFRCVDDSSVLAWP